MRNASKDDLRLCLMILTHTMVEASSRNATPGAFFVFALAVVVAKERLSATALEFQLYELL